MPSQLSIDPLAPPEPLYPCSCFSSIFNLVAYEEEVS